MSELRTPSAASGTGMQLRARATPTERLHGQESPGERAMKAALQYLQADFDSPAAAAQKWGVERQLVNYYIRKLSSQGMERSERSETSEKSTRNSTQSPVDGLDADTDAITMDWDARYEKAWVYAGELCKEMGRAKAAKEASERFNVSISASSARRSFLAKGVFPGKRGASLNIPRDIEYKLEDLCLCLREMQLPVFRYMVLNYINTLVAGTSIAENFKDREVKRHWYYRWLGRCKRLKTANLTPLEMTRAQWATPENLKKHYDMLADMLVELKLAVPNPSFDPYKPRDERLHIIKPERIFSMDETRLTNDTTEKNKSKGNRSVVSKCASNSHEVLANKGGGDGTGIGGSAANGMDLPGFFIFAKDIIHREDVTEAPQCRRVDPKEPSKLLPSRYFCNEKGGVTGDLGVRYVRGCIEPCLPDLSVDNPALLIMDGHGSHFTLELLKYCRSIGLHVVLRPPHTTHIVQGEDVVHFHNFKPEYHQAKMMRLSQNVLSGNARLTVSELLSIAKKPWERAFNLENCLKAWASIGVVPFNQCVYWDLLEAKAKRERTADRLELDPEMLTVRGMVGILFPDAARAPAPAKRKRDALNSSELWDLPGGATGDDVYRIVEAKTNAKKEQAERAKKKKEDSRQRKSDAWAELLSVGAAIVAKLVAAQHIPRLKVAQLKAILSFRAVEYSKSAKKAELVQLVCDTLKLPMLNPLPDFPSNLPDVTSTAPAGSAPAAAAAPDSGAPVGEASVAEEEGEEEEGEEEEEEEEDFE
ncbi:hypothetical protein AB1Y20_015588 [Prymnesium parvum]|uniref:DDE-1 domain-containing protein n=2 Tax=Prymnesium parvum TaxID=97485 RepID=A0AB34K0M2_PRYPA